MKENLIRLTDEKNLFYDSNDRLYRYRMHCPYCGRESGCRCFPTLEKVEDFIENSMSFICSSKCFLKSLIDDQGIDDIRDTMFEMGVVKCWLKHLSILSYYFSIWRLKWYVFKFIGYISEKDAYEVIDAMDIDFDSVEGEFC